MITVFIIILIISPVLVGLSYKIGIMIAKKKDKADEELFMANATSEEKRRYEMNKNEAMMNLNKTIAANKAVSANRYY